MTAPYSAVGAAGKQSSHVPEHTCIVSENMLLFNGFAAYSAHLRKEEYIEPQNI